MIPAQREGLAQGVGHRGAALRSDRLRRARIEGGFLKGLCHRASGIARAARAQFGRARRQRGPGAVERRRIAIGQIARAQSPWSDGRLLPVAAASSRSRRRLMTPASERGAPVES
jgi:hypothetical protein